MSGCYQLEFFYAVEYSVKHRSVFRQFIVSKDKEKMKPDAWGHYSVKFVLVEAPGFYNKTAHPVAVHGAFEFLFGHGKASHNRAYFSGLCRHNKVNDSQRKNRKRFP